MSNDSNNHSNVQVTDEVCLHVVSVPSGISYNSATDGGWEAKPGILATARNAAGSPTEDFSRRGVTVLLDPSDENTRTPIEAAVSVGVLQRDGLGGYHLNAGYHQRRFDQMDLRDRGRHDPVTSTCRPNAVTNNSRNCMALRRSRTEA